MERIKRKLIIEVIIDIIFILLLICGTIYGVIYVFPEVKDTEIVTIEKYECDNAYDCICNGYKCNCKYCLDEDCNEYKDIKCKK